MTVAEATKFLSRDQNCPAVVEQVSDAGDCVQDPNDNYKLLQRRESLILIRKWFTKHGTDERTEP